MARYNRINIDGRAETENRQMKVDALAGTLVFIGADDKFDKFVTSGGGEGVQLYALGTDYTNGKRVTDPVTTGDIGIGNYFEEGRSFAMLVKAAAALVHDTPLAVDATGVLRAGVIGTDHIVAFSKENYTVGATPELVIVRAA